MRRPRSIMLFGVAYLTYGGVMLIHGFIMRNWWSLRTEEYLGDLALPVVLGFRLAVVLLLAWAVYFKASKIAKWLIVLQIASLLYRLPQGWGGIVEGNARAIIWMVGFAAGVVAVLSLFPQGSRQWFQTKGRPVEALASVFE